MTLISKLKLSVFYDIISPQCLPIFTELSKDVTFKNVKLDLKPVNEPTMELSFGTYADDNRVLSLKNDVKFINARYNFGIEFPDNWYGMWLNNKTQHIQKFLANLTSVNGSNESDLIEFNLKLLRLFWIENKFEVNEDTLQNLKENFSNLNANFDHSCKKELEKNITNAAEENAIEIPFFVLTGAKNRRYIYRGFESLPLIRNDILLLKDRLNTVVCNL